MTTGPSYSLDLELARYLDAAADLHGALFERPWNRPALEDLLSVSGTDGAAALVSDRTPRFAGFVLFRTLGDFSEILTLAVAPENRRQGIGRLLMEQAVHAARESGAERLVLEVQDGNRSAISLYESLGMTPFDRRRNYYKSGDGSHADAILMQLFLDN
ncbi:ribosomal protein S18-alanine N-acetyltransferase [Nisaea acidiphila]|uniref:Ribosomal protein S18-alanine N-acetyltransferase n=1 Tax=Nisaea acidiphila TaxID=1862145 RepID=A0A9J7B0E2_9PROT|nr:ribosomal protein S18-alanine N-acetyltransferase [Nisaea acidiphila]UUX52129.1 ribosomal protein S18-alanine N-acetyltransferase [Nisaea acidiphila]